MFLSDRGRRSRSFIVNAGGDAMSLKPTGEAQPFCISLIRRDRLFSMTHPSDSYCVLPFMHLEVSHGGEVKPCCNAQYPLISGPGENLNVNRHELDEIWGSNAFNELRSQLISGQKPQICSRCWDDERLGIYSKRLRSNLEWERHVTKKPLKSPAVIDLKLGNLCNLKCRICSRTSSSKFASEEFKIFKNFNLDDNQARMKWSQDEKNEFWRRLDDWLPQIEQIDIYGGEPLLSQPHYLLLERAIEIGSASTQSLHYNTNGTIFPEKVVREVWPHFKSVELMLSIDGVGRQFTYQRHPAPWEILVKNVEKFKENAYLKLKVCFTVSAMNIWYIPEFISWCKSIGLTYWINYLHDPSQFRVSIFSDNARRAIEDHLRQANRQYNCDQIEPLINFLWDKPYSQDDRERFLSQIKIYDDHRGENFRDVFPDTYLLLQTP